MSLKCAKCLKFGTKTINMPLLRSQFIITYFGLIRVHTMKEIVLIEYPVSESSMTPTSSYTKPILEV